MDKNIKYINKDFDDFKSDLIEYAKSYFPNTYNDFSESNPGNLFIEMASYIGDVLSFYQDEQFQETNPQFAKQKKNLLALAYLYGYKPKVTSASSTLLDIYQLVPAKEQDGNIFPDFDYALIFNPESTFISETTSQTFILQDTVDFSYSSSNHPTDITVYSYDTIDPTKPQFYLLKKTGKVISGNIKSETFVFNEGEKFKNIYINDNNIISIIDAIDSEGNKWYEVPYLAQETILDSIPNTDNDIPYILKLKKVPRRFVSRFISDNSLSIEFGSGISGKSDEEIIPNPENIGLNTDLNLSYDPSNFMNTRTYGLSPSNISITFRYIVGGGISSNVGSNDINLIGNLNLTYNDTLLNIDQIISSIAINNPTKALGGKDGDSIDDLRMNIISSFPTQQRAITSDDYVVRSLSLPSKFGSIAKAYIAKNNNFQLNDPLLLDLYISGYDKDKHLTSPSINIKNNLKEYLSQFRSLTDSIQIKEAFIINIGINFDIIVLSSFNSKEVLTNCILSLKDYFNIDKWQINQPIFINDIINEITKVKGVQTVNKIEIYNMSKEGYSDFSYDIPASTRNNIIYPSLDPCIFEIKYPDNDIKGRITKF